MDYRNEVNTREGKHKDDLWDKSNNENRENIKGEIKKSKVITMIKIKVMV